MNCVKKIYFNSELESSSKYKTDEGYLVNLSVPISRSGIFVYKGFEFGLDGDEASRDVVVYRPIEVFDDGLLSQISNLPVTNSHPENGVDSENITDEIIGTLGDKVYMDGADVIAEKVIVYDKGSINEIESGVKQEVSIGFDAEYTPCKGEFDGKEYDYVEKITRVNHLALVSKGKAGSRYRLNEDVSKGTDELTEEKGMLKSKNEEYKDESKQENEVEQPIKTDDSEKMSANQDGMGDIKDMLSKILETVTKLVSLEEAEKKADESDDSEDESSDTSEDTSQDDGMENECDDTEVKNVAMKNSIMSSVDKKDLHTLLSGKSVNGVGDVDEFKPSVSAQDVINSFVK